MLEEFEQKKLLEYLIEGLSKAKIKQVKSITVESLLEVINDCYDDLSINFNLNLPDDNENINRKSTNDKMKNYISFLKKEYSKLKNVQISQRENILLIIQKIFNLSEIEKEVLGFIVRKEISDTFSSCLGIFNKNIQRKEILASVKICLKKSSKIVLSINKLREFGFLEGYTLSSYFQNIFMEESNVSQEVLCEKIIGVKSKTVLNTRDFCHLKDELNTVKTIIKSSIAQKEKGINILFYGAVGTGKTEPAKANMQNNLLMN